MNETQNKGWKFFLLGMAILLAAHGIAFGILMLVSPRYDEIAYFHLFGIGLTQFVYALPLVIVLFIKQQKTLAYGVLTMMGITFLLNSACFGFLFLAGGLGSLH